MIKILAYGSLRKGDYNYQRMIDYFGKNSINKITELKLPNYEMYDLGSYPCLIENEKSKNTVTFDIIEVNSECYNFIKNMELNAGYIEKSVGTPQGICKIYLYPENPKTTLIKEGDWLIYKNN